MSVFTWRPVVLDYSTADGLIERYTYRGGYIQLAPPFPAGAFPTTHQISSIDLRNVRIAAMHHIDPTTTPRTEPVAHSITFRLRLTHYFLDENAPGDGGSFTPVELDLWTGQTEIYTVGFTLPEILIQWPGGATYNMIRLDLIADGGDGTGLDYDWVIWSDSGDVRFQRTY